MTSGPIFRSPQHKPVAEFLTTHQIFVDVCLAISHPDPPHACRCASHTWARWGPDLGLAGAFEPLLRGLSGLATGRPHVILLIPSADHLDRLPLVVVLWGVWPAHAQHRVHKEPLESCSAITDGTKTCHSLFSRPGQLCR